MLGVSFFLTASSLASLSKVIISWKGFILEGLNTYQVYFVSPIVSVATSIGLEYEAFEIHAAVLLSISVTTGMRLLSMGQIVAFDEINQKYASNMKPNLMVYRFIGFLFPPAVWLGYGLSSKPVNLYFVISLFVFYPLLLVVPKLIMDKFSLESGYYIEKGKFNYFKSYYSYILTAVLIVCILGAINIGLRRPLLF